MIRVMLFMSLILAMAYVVYLQSEAVNQHDLNEAENEIQKQEQKVNEFMKEHQKNLEQKLPQ